MAGKYFLIDTTRCTACRGCQVACKEWNQLPATKTRQTGSYQNPQDLNGDTWRLVRFAEHPTKTGGMVWYFFSDACRHCLEPPCKEVADEKVKGAIVVDKKTGAVIYTDKAKKLKAAADEINLACPWGVPHWSDHLGRMAKCTMCIDRVEAGLKPACVAACPTGALNFGDEGEIKKLAVTRVEKARKRFGRGDILDAKDVRVLFLVIDEQAKYFKSA